MKAKIPRKEQITRKKGKAKLLERRGRQNY
jgi:hypothetical protein